MLQNIRDNSQGCISWVIVGLISLTFAVWGVGEFGLSSSQRIIAEVNGVEIPERDFLDQVNQQKNRLRSMFKNQDLDLSFMQEQIRKSTLQQMIDEELLVQSAIGSGMRISNGLLAARIHSFEAFQSDGKFSQAIYEQLLQRQGLSPISFEMDMQRSLLTEQVRQGIVRSSLVTDQEQRMTLENQQRSISYLIISTDRFTDVVTISDAEVETYYKENLAQYMTPEQVSIEYVKLSNEDIDLKEGLEEESIEQAYKERKESFTTPAKWQARHILLEVAENTSLTDMELLQEKAKGILAEVKADDKSFAELAKQYSDDIGTKNKGGDLGWFEPGTMVKPFEDAVKAMQVGDISDLVKSRFGFHIIKLEAANPEVIKTLAEVREQIKQDLSKELMESEFYTQVDELGNLAFENPNSLDVITETLGLKSKTTELFARDEVHPQDSVLGNQKIIKAAFSDSVLKENFNSEVIDVGEQQAVVLRLKDHVPAKDKSLEEVKNDVVATLTKDKTKSETKKLGEGLLEQIKQGTAPNSVIQTHDLTWSVPQLVKRKDSAIAQQEILQQVFKMGYPTDKQAIYQGLELDNGDYALIVVLEVKDGEKVDEINTKYQQALGDSEFNQLISGLKTDAEIKDNSKKLADDS
ncbi:SurA N-terminal domain-containing protein [Candidatus Halobeggiatoa sp. HSG11]|nr:SurA N-terminal domain-containing protein [Candidatus Halobeggiatoa sp. HSG11]